MAVHELTSRTDVTTLRGLRAPLARQELDLSYPCPPPSRLATGALIPRDVRLSHVHRSGGTQGSAEKEVRTSALYSRQYLGLKSLAGGRLAQDTLTDLGRLLLVDASRYRSS